jgi:6-pyruvoyltetrahydropterin/6-carboxytetrahydropterin synthase
MLITRRVEFSASHICSRPDLTPEENQSIYGFQANPKGHGHNYVLEVTLEGEPNPETGMVFDLKTLKEIVDKEVVGPMDHRFLNYEIPPFDQIVPTTENVAIEIWRRLEPHFSHGGPHLKNVRLYETEDLFVDYGGSPS